MKKILLGSIATIALSSTAFAADLPAYTKAPAPVVSPVYNWGGFYIGLNGGGGSARNCWTNFANNNGTTTTLVNPPQAEGCHNATGATVGGQVGYRWQASNWVFGLEAQGNWANFSGNNVNQAPGLVPLGGFIDNSKMNAFGLFTGQVGYAFNNVLIYAKGGAAVVNDKYTITLTPLGAAVGQQIFPSLVAGQSIATGSETRWGGTVGAGAEFGFAPHWSVALEYDHLFMGTKNVTMNLLPPFPAGSSSSHSIRQDVDIGTVRVNYTFGGPVVAKY
jgi:outer membrane immunogenic protein